MLDFFLQKWKDAHNFEGQAELHYLEKQRIATLNSICWILIVFSILITLVYVILDFSNKFIPLIALPISIITIWFNYNKKYTLARNIAFFGALIAISIWCIHDRRTGTELLLIALANGSVSVYEKRKNAYLGMIICSVFFLVYKIYDYSTPFVINERINYVIINTILTFATAGIIFFQAIINVDLGQNISKELDKNFKILKVAFENQKTSDENLKSANTELNNFNQKLDFLVKKAVEELQSYQTAIDDNLNSIVTNCDGIIVKINNRYLQKSGYKKEELLGKNINILKSDYHSIDFYKEIDDKIASGNVWRGESKIKTKNGEDLWLLSSILPIKDDTGKIIEFLTISADITDKKEVEKKEKIASNKLSKSERKVGLLLEHQTDLIVISDKFGNRNYVNKSFYEFFGKDKDYFIGTNYRTLEIDNLDEFYLKIFDSLSYENPKITITIVRENALGQKRWIKWDEMAFFDANNEVTEVLSIGHDITEMKENEFQNANYIAQFEELAFKNSHHFRKPLSNIIGLISLIDGKTTESEINEIFNIVKSEISDLDSSSKELSEFINLHSINKKHDSEVFNTDFINAKLMHLKWKYKIKHYLDGEGSLTDIQAISPEDSDFGKWYYTEGKAKYGHLEPVIKFEKQNLKLHQQVSQILQLQKEGSNELAEKKYKELVSISDKIILLLDEAEQYVNNKNATILV